LSATNEFKISYLGIGPTEIRLIFIVVNTLLIIFNKTYMAAALPYVLTFSAFGLFVVIFKTQKYLWKVDMDQKKNEQNPQNHN